MLKKRIAFLALAASLLSLQTIMTSSEARADIPVKSLYVGIYGGADIPLDDWDFGAIRQNRPEIGGVVGLRLGFHATWWFAAEIGVGANIFTDSAEGSNVGINLSADLLFHFIEGDWVPFLDVGAGAFILAAGDLEGDEDYHIHWGLGLRGMLLDWLALRIDARHILGDPAPTDAIFSNMLEVTLGLDFYAWAEDKTPPDTDLDGILDPDDQCPKVAGPAATGGCPDADGDGIVDAQDKCPNTPGKVELQGCPDTDGDGIADADDKCPNTPGVVEHKGCPPPPPPKPADRDKDGVADKDDKCPDVPGLAIFQGCPDTDRDGIQDKDDKCPKIPGVKEEQGCLPKAVSKFTGAIKGIYFSSGSAKIRKKSYKTLNRAVKVLAKWKTVRLQVEGHTDNRGKDSSNMKLSQARAESVMAYFVSKGLDKNRFIAKGFGEEKPIASNKSGKGRGKNRRIEFTVIGNN